MCFICTYVRSCIYIRIYIYVYVYIEVLRSWGASCFFTTWTIPTARGAPCCLTLHLSTVWKTVSPMMFLLQALGGLPYLVRNVQGQLATTISQGCSSVGEVGPHCSNQSISFLVATSFSSRTSICISLMYSFPGAKHSKCFATSSPNATDR